MAHITVSVCEIAGLIPESTNLAYVVQADIILPHFISSLGLSFNCPLNCLITSVALE